MRRTRAVACDVLGAARMRKLARLLSFFVDELTSQFAWSTPLRLRVCSIVPLLLVAGVVCGVGCGDGADVGGHIENLTTLPPSLPLCDKNGPELLLFARYDASSCGGARCYPACP